MMWIPALLDVIAWPFFVIGGVAIFLMAALVAAVVAITVAIIRRRRKK